MREPERDFGRLQDIIEAVRDKLRYFAVVKNVEIIGEAANIHTHLPIGFGSFGWSTSISEPCPTNPRNRLLLTLEDGRWQLLKIQLLKFE